MGTSMLFIIGFVLMGACVNVNTLQCYECTDCPDGKVTDEDLVTCAVETTTTVIVTIPSTTPVESTEVTNTTPASGTEATSTTPTSGTEAASSTPASGTEAASTTPASGTEAASSTPVSGTEATSTTPATGSEAAITTTADSTDPEVMRVRRHILPEIENLDNGCRCNGKPCACYEEYQEDAVERVLPYADNDTITFVCAKVVSTINGTEVTARGCAPTHLNGVEFCKFSEAFNTTSCTTCSTDKCNNAFVFQHSIPILILVLTLGWFAK